jgi:hypothetical protein
VVNRSSADHSVDYVTPHPDTIQITPSLLTPYQTLYPIPSPTQSSTLETLGSYKDIYLQGFEDEQGGRQGEDEVERVRAGVMLHAVNHVLK